MKKEKIFAANWKMYLTPHQAVDLTHKLNIALSSFAATYPCTIILCPSFSSLPLIQPIIESSSLFLGAQNCSSFSPGAHTGEESIQTLKELRCSYCIVGHSERRLNNYESNENISQKVKNLLSNNITPIVCIGETIDEYKEQRTKEVLTKQLNSLFAALTNISSQKKQLVCIAYEPIWAIGSGLIPQEDYLIEMFNWLNHTCSQNLSTLQWKLLYGGSVKSTNTNILASIAHLDGFLIGSSSLDFQEFEKIVHYACQ